MGRYYWNRETADGLRLSFRYLVAAIQKDPGYTLAHAAMADWSGTRHQPHVPSAEALPKAKAAALRALELILDSLRPMRAWDGLPVSNGI